MTSQRDRHQPGIPIALHKSTILKDYRAFLATAVRNPRMVGAATPTSSAVASTVAQVVPTTGTPVVVELGPGTGSLSDAIHARMPEGSRHLGIELGEDLVRHLRAHKPWLETVHGDAADLERLLHSLGITEVDALITSIPWTFFDDRTQRDMLRQCAKMLVPHGAFTALTYVPAERTEGGRRFRAHLEATFDEILTPITWRNFLPLMHYICRRPLL